MFQCLNTAWDEHVLLQTLFPFCILTLFLRHYSCSSEIYFSNNRDLTKKLHFTGVQYHTVILVLGEGSPLLLHGTGFLYHVISRAIYRVIVICHERDFHYFDKFLAPHEADRQVLDKLRKSKNVPIEDFQLLTDKTQWETALDLVIVSKNSKTFEEIKNLVIEQVGYEDVLRHLIQCFPWGEDGEILRMIESLNTQIMLTIDDFDESLIDASNLLCILPNEQKRHLLWQRLKQISRIDVSGFSRSLLPRIKNFRPLWISFSLLWHDEELYQTSICDMTSFFMACSHHLSQCFDALPSSMKNEMNCVPLIDGEALFPDYKTARYYFCQATRTPPRLRSFHFPIIEIDLMLSILHDIYTGSNENLKMFFMKIWEELLANVFGFLNFDGIVPKWTEMELVIIRTFGEICDEKANESEVSTDLTVALQLSLRVSEARRKLAANTASGKSDSELQT